MDREEKVIFAVAPPAHANAPVTVVLGVPEGAWRYMNTGRTHTFDLTSLGLPIQIVMYGGQSHDHTMELIKPLLAEDVVDARDRDFGIEPK